MLSRLILIWTFLLLGWTWHNTVNEPKPLTKKDFGNESLEIPSLLRWPVHHAKEAAAEFGDKLRNMIGLEADRRLQELASGYKGARSIYVAAKLGVSDLLEEGPRSASSLAEELKVGKGTLESLLEYLSALGVFVRVEEEEGGGGGGKKSPEISFGLTKISALLSSSHPSSLRNWVIQQNEVASAWNKLLDVVITNKDGEGGEGEEGEGDQHHHHSGLCPDISHSCSILATDLLSSSSSDSSPPPSNLVVLGSQRPLLVAALLSSHPANLSVYVADVAMLEKTREFWKSHLHSSRVNVEQLTEDTQLPPANLYVLANSLSHKPSRKGTNLILRAYKKTHSGSLVLIERVPREDDPLLVRTDHSVCQVESLLSGDSNCIFSEDALMEALQEESLGLSVSSFVQTRSPWTLVTVAK